MGYLQCEYRGEGGARRALTPSFLKNKLFLPGFFSIIVVIT